MSGKVWAVTAGDRDDYHIIAVFSTKERAKAYWERTLWVDAQIEEFDFDPEPDEVDP